MRIVQNEAIEYLLQSEARALLGDGIGLAIAGALREAFRRWKSSFPGLLALPSASLRALAMHEVSVEDLSARLGEHPRVRVIEADHGRRRAHFIVR
ncbi:MAG: hypothetical protein ACHREM_03145, partial [Polyangiales bacterium]